MWYNVSVGGVTWMGGVEGCGIVSVVWRDVVNGVEGCGIVCLCCGVTWVDGVEGCCIVCLGGGVTWVG